MSSPVSPGRFVFYDNPEWKAPEPWSMDALRRLSLIPARGSGHDLGAARQSGNDVRGDIRGGKQELDGGSITDISQSVLRLARTILIIKTTFKRVLESRFYWGMIKD